MNTNFKSGFVWLPVLLGVLGVLVVSGGAWWYVQQKAVPATEQSQELSQASSLVFTANPASGPAPLSLWFSAALPGGGRDDKVYTVDTGDGRTLQMSWDNGKGTPDAWALSVYYTYSSAGTYIATLYADGAKAATVSVAVVQPTEWRPASMLPGTYSYGWTWYWLAGGVISCMSNPVPQADAQTFEAASIGEYARDKNHVYRCNDILADADPKTFVVLGSGYGKDAKHVYVNGIAVTGADATTFELVGQSKRQLEYSKDKNHVYSLGREVLNADPRTFAAIGNEWYTDKNSQFVNGRRVRGVTADIFLKGVVASLPPQCQKGYFAQSNYPIPSQAASMFSADGSVRGYGGGDICIVDSKTNAAEYYRLPGESPVLSRDGSKMYYTKYYGKEWGMGDLSQAEIDAFYKMYNAGDYGLRVFERKSSADTLLVHSVLPPIPSSVIAVFWTGGGGSGEIVDVDIKSGLLVQMSTDAKQRLLIVRKLPQTQWDFLTQADVERLPQVRTVQLPPGEEFRSVAEVSPDGKYVDYLHVKSGTVLPAYHGRLNISTGENILSTY